MLLRIETYLIMVNINFPDRRYVQRYVYSARLRVCAVVLKSTRSDTFLHLAGISEGYSNVDEKRDLTGNLAPLNVQV